MKKIVLLLMLCMALFAMTGCTEIEQALGKIGDEIEASQLDTPQAGSTAGDWGFVITVRDMATKMFTEGVPDAEIVNTRVASKNGGDERVICVIEYKRGSASGNYGFEYEKQEDGTYELKRYGEGVRTDDLM